MQMRPILVFLSGCVFAPSYLFGQQSVCNLFKDLKSADDKQLTLSGELVLSGSVAVLGAADCDNKYVSERQIWPTGLNLRMAGLPPQDRQRVRDLTVRTIALRQAGKVVTVSGVLSGRLHLGQAGDFPAELTVDSVDKIEVEELPDSSQLPVIPICDLFRDLAAWKGKRIAVRGEGVGTMEGYWIGGQCKGAFFTGGYRWPVSLTYGAPAWYSGSTADLAEAKQPRAPAKNEDLFRGRNNVVRTGIYIGRLRMRDQYFANCRAGGDYITNGFGHLNGAAAELVVEEVRDVELNAGRASTEEEQDPPCVPPDHDSLCARAAKLQDAVSANCLDRARELISNEGIDSKDGSESTALGYAIRLGNAAVVSLMLDAGAPVNPSHVMVSSPLEESAQFGRFGIMKMLLARGAKVDRLDDRGEAYLSSLGFFSAPALKILLDAGANPNSKDRHGETALMHAADYGFDESARLLIQHKADVNLTDAGGRTALMHAAAGKYVDAIPLLLAAKADLHARDPEGKSALDIAKASGNEAAAELISAAIPGGK